MKIVRNFTAVVAAAILAGSAFAQNLRTVAADTDVLACMVDIPGRNFSMLNT